MADWPADKVERRKVADLVPYARNSRTHSPEQIDQIAASVEQWGWTVPVLVDEAGEIIAGHGRVLAAKKLKLKDVPVMVATGWSDEQKRAYVIADNKLALNAGWDEPMLADELAGIAASGFDTSLIGFTADELNDLLQDEIDEDGETEDDAAPSIEIKAISRHGDIWLLGDHRVMCGDSTSIDDVSRLVGPEPVDACWTDPPYNVDYEGKAGKIKNDSMSSVEFRQFLYDAFTNAFSVMKKGAPIYVAHADTEGYNFRGAFADAGFKLSGSLVWVKPSLVLGRSDYQWRHEPILYGWKPGERHQWYGGRDKTTVTEFEDAPWRVDEDGSVVITMSGSTIRISGKDLVAEEVPASTLRAEKPKRNTEHLTMKPVELVLSMLKNSTKRGQRVLDLFGGSGSTLIACHKSDRTALLMEFDPLYCDVIVRRWQEFTGRDAVLESDLKTFAEKAGGKGKKAA